MVAIGRGLFWTTGTLGERAVWAADVTTASGRLTPSQPRLLFRNPLLFMCHPVGCLDISPDGTRFVAKVGVAPDSQPVREIRIVLNWFAELTRLVPTS